MISNIRINDLNLLRFCHSRVTGKDMRELKNAFPSDKYACLGEYKGKDDPLWAVTFYNFTEGHDCSIDIALNVRGLFAARLFKKIARVTFDYAFNQANLKRCTVTVRKSNKASQRLVKAWGFKEEGCKRLGYAKPIPEDMYLFGLLKEECKWIGGHHG